MSPLGLSFSQVSLLALVSLFLTSCMPFEDPSQYPLQLEDLLAETADTPVDLPSAELVLPPEDLDEDAAELLPELVDTLPQDLPEVVDTDTYDGVDGNDGTEVPDTPTDVIDQDIIQNSNCKPCSECTKSNKQCLESLDTNGTLCVPPVQSPQCWVHADCEEETPVCVGVESCACTSVSCVPKAGTCMPPQCENCAESDCVFVDGESLCLEKPETGCRLNSHCLLNEVCEGASLTTDGICKPRIAEKCGLLGHCPGLGEVCVGDFCQTGYASPDEGCFHDGHCGLLNDDFCSQTLFPGEPWPEWPGYCTNCCSEQKDCDTPLVCLDSICRDLERLPLLNPGQCWTQRDCASEMKLCRRLEAVACAEAWVPLAAPGECECCETNTQCGSHRCEGGHCLDLLLEGSCWTEADCSGNDACVGGSLGNCSQGLPPTLGTCTAID